jgi:hypothetical protein
VHDRGYSEYPVSVLRQHPFTEGGSVGNNRFTETQIIAPDDVATVTARYETQKYPGRVRKPVIVTKHVSNNLVFFVFRGAWDPPSLTYRSATGKVLWSRRRR